jgi:hypothetical protein
MREIIFNGLLYPVRDNSKKQNRRITMKKLLFTFSLLCAVAFAGRAMITQYEEPGQIEGGRMTYVSTNTFTVGLTNRITQIADYTNKYMFIFTNALTCDITVDGLGGNDRSYATLETNKIYAVYICGNTVLKTNYWLIISTNWVKPYLTAQTNKYGTKYANTWRRVGSVFITTNGTQVLVPFSESGYGRVKRVLYDYDKTPFDVTVNAGTNTTFTAITVSTLVPNGCRMAILNVDTAASNAVHLSQNGGSLATTQTVANHVGGLYVGLGVHAASIAEVGINTSYQFYYRASAGVGANTIQLLGFIDELY